MTIATSAMEPADLLALKIDTIQKMVGTMISKGSFVDVSLQFVKGVASRHVPAGEEIEKCSWCGQIWPCADIQSAWKWAQ